MKVHWPNLAKTLCVALLICVALRFAEVAGWINLPEWFPAAVGSVVGLFTPWRFLK